MIIVASLSSQVNIQGPTAALGLLFTTLAGLLLLAVLALAFNRRRP